jgi:hypothetical protein
MAIRSAVVAALLLAACGDNTWPREEPYFKWDGKPTVGAMDITDLDASNDGPLLSKLAHGHDDNWIVMIYGHRPGELVSLDTIQALLQQAQDEQLPFYTFAQLALDDGIARHGINLSFDDTEIDDWYSLRPLLQQYGAHVTLFVTRYAQFTDDGRQKLHQLYDEGNDVEAHGVNHVNGPDYVAQYGLDAYLADEVQPSIDILREDGFDPVAFAHPFGAHTPEIDEAITARLALVRSISQTPLPGHDVW